MFRQANSAPSNDCEANASPKVSVVLPVYNGEPYLPEAIESILNQTFNDFEFIIIDDGSQDKTWQIANTYAEKDRRLVLYRNPSNLGLIKSLNKGLELARGKYVARQDADDISLPDRLAKQVEYFEQHPEIGLLGTAYYRLNGQGERILRCPPATDTDIRWKLLFDNVWCHASMMFRRALIKVGEPFYRDFLHAEDYELWTRLLKKTRASTLSIPLVIYREHENSICSKNWNDQVSMVAKISAQEINTFFQQRLKSFEIDVLQRLYQRQFVTKKDMVVGGTLLVELFEQFKKQNQVEPRIFKNIQKGWIKRFLLATPGQQWKDILTSGLLFKLCHVDVQIILKTLIFYMPKELIRRFKPALKLYWHIKNFSTPRLKQS